MDLSRSNHLFGSQSISADFQQLDPLQPKIIWCCVRQKQRHDPEVSTGRWLNFAPHPTVADMPNAVLEKGKHVLALKIIFFSGG